MKLKTLVIGLLICVLAVVLAARHPKSPSPSTALNKSQKTTASEQPFDKSRFSTDEAASLWVIVNKGRILPASYVPANLVVPDVPLRLSAAYSEMHLRADTAAAMEGMFADAKQNGINLMLASGYRSYSEQAALYNGYVKSLGLAEADATSAHPGHSEHQTGLSADIEPASRSCEVEVCFESTPEGKWLAANSYKYGFIIRYKKDQTALSGYAYEPWHIRYIGKDLAQQLETSGQTLEQFFGLPAYTDYPASQTQLK